jgi:hypothetical protein
MCNVCDALQCDPDGRSSKFAPGANWQHVAVMFHLPARPHCPPLFAPALPAVRGLLLDSRKAQSSNYVPAVADGVLALRAATGGDAQGRHAAGLSAAAGQQAQVAMLCLERLIALGKCGLPQHSCRLVNFLAAMGLGSLSLPAANPPLPHPGSLPTPSCRSCIQQQGSAGGAAGPHRQPAGEAVQAGAGERLRPRWVLHCLGLVCVGVALLWWRSCASWSWRLTAAQVGVALHCSGLLGV